MSILEKQALQLPEIINSKPSLQYVRCNACSCAFTPKIVVKRNSEIEYTFFHCDYCNKFYMVSITDEKLRQDIAKYAALTLENKEHRLSPEKMQEAIELLRANKERAYELKNLYFKEESHE